MLVNGTLKFSTLGFGELQNAIIERVTVLPSTTISGRIVYHTPSNNYYFHNGTTWIAFGSSSTVAALQTEIDAVETTLGAFVNNSGTFNFTAFNGFSNLSGLNSSSTLLDVLGQLDSAIVSAGGNTSLISLSDTNISNQINGNVLFYDSSTTFWKNNTFPTPLTDGDLLQWSSSSNNWKNVASTAIGSVGYGIVTGNTGIATANAANDTITIIGAAGGGITIAATDNPSALQVMVNPANLNTMGSTIVVADELMLHDVSSSVVNKVTVTKLVNDLNIPNNISSNGLITRTGEDTYASRSIVVDSNAAVAGLTITNGNATLGNPTIGLDINNASALVGSVSTSDSLMMYDLSTTSNVKVTVAQLAAAIAAPGTLNDLTDVTITSATADDTLQYIGGAWVNRTPSQVRTTLDIYSTTQANSTFVNVTGDSMSGTLNMSNNIISNVATPVNPNDAATKGYVDSVAAGLSWKETCRAATTANITFSGLITIDGVALQTGDRVLLKNQTFAQFNGIYVASSGSWARASDFDSSTPLNQINGAAVFVREGTVNGGTGWLVTSTVTTFNSDPIVWTQFTTGGASSIAIDDLSNVVVSAPAAGHALVYNGTNWVNRKVQHVYNSALNSGAVTSHTVTHNLNTQFPNITVYSSSLQQITPLSVTITNVNTVTVTFTSATQCYVVVSGITGVVAQ